MFRCTHVQPMNKQPPSLSTRAQPSESNKSLSIVPWQLIGKLQMEGKNEQTPGRGPAPREWGLQSRVQGSLSLFDG